MLTIIGLLILSVVAIYLIYCAIQILFYVVFVALIGIAAVYVAIFFALHLLMNEQHMGIAVTGALVLGSLILWAISRYYDKQEQIRVAAEKAKAEALRRQKEAAEAQRRAARASSAGPVKRWLRQMLD